MKTKNDTDFRRKVADLIEHYGSEYQVANALGLSQNTVLSWSRDDQKAYKSSVALVNVAWGAIQMSKEKASAPTYVLPTYYVKQDIRGRQYALRHTETPADGTYCIIDGVLGKWYKTDHKDGNIVFESLVNKEPKALSGPPDHEVMCRLISADDAEMLRVNEP